MAKRNNKRSLAKTIPFQLKIKRTLLKSHRTPDYKLLFESLSPKDFLSYIFIKPFCALNYAHKWRIDYPQSINAFQNIYEYFHSDDLYQYFVINHSLNFNLEAEKYSLTIFKVIVDLKSQITKDASEGYEDNSTPKPIMIDGMTKIKDNSLANLAREYYTYGRTISEIKDKMYPYKRLMKKLREIHQQDLGPIDISQPSYLF